MTLKLFGNVVLGWGYVNQSLHIHVIAVYWYYGKINANAWKAAFWLVARIFHDLNLQMAVEQEIVSPMSQNL